MNKFLLLLILLSTHIFAVTPTPTPTTLPIGMTPPPYEPVCGTDPRVDCMDTSPECGKITYYNQSQLENNGGTYLYDGICPTPTPKPSVEVICDAPHIVTSSNLTKTSKKRKAIFFNTLTSTQSSNSLIRINPSGIKFIREDSEHLFSYFYIPNEGTWRSTIDGSVGFFPDEDFNGTSTINYVVYDNCGTPSNPSTLKATIDSNETTTPQVVFEPTCIFLTLNDLLIVDDIRIITPDTKISLIDVLDNDTPYVSPASLRLVDKDDNLVTKLTDKDKGKWLVDTNAGDILFIPNKNFRDNAEVKYVVNNQCNTTSGDNDKHYDFEHNIATITVIMSTPTPQPCPQTKEPICGQENLCKVSPLGETICLASIPRNTTYTNMCELFKSGDVFLYAGACHTPTPTPTPQIIYIDVTPTPKPTPTPTATPTPKPKPITMSDTPKPTTKPAQPAETNTTQNISTVKSSNGSALGMMSLFMLVLLTLITGRNEINRRGKM